MATIVLTLSDAVENGVQAVRMAVTHDIDPNSPEANLPPTQAMKAAIHMIQVFQTNSGVPPAAATDIGQKEIINGAGEVHHLGFDNADNVPGD